MMITETRWGEPSPGFDEEACQVGRVSTTIDFPLGTITVTAGDHSLLGVLLPGKSAGKDSPSPAAELLAHRARDQMTRYLNGESVTFDLPLDFDAVSAFDHRVLTELALVPRGSVLTYGQLAGRIGNPRAARAVGGAMARNPFPIILPCHRVIAATGDPGGFGGGLQLKRWLLELEGVTGVRWPR